VLTTHYLDEADELADHIVVIDHGKAIAAGTTAELKAGVGRDVIEVAPVDAFRLDEAAAVLGTLTVGPAIVDPVAHRVRGQASDGTAQLSAAIAALSAAGIPVSEIALRHPTLDEVFLALTGDHATDRGGGPATDSGDGAADTGDRATDTKAGSIR
jgi:ABC-2 type transport system ATP-binding protein